MAKKKALKPKHFYLSFELYATPGGKPRICTSFVPTTEISLPDINTLVDKRPYGIHIDNEKEYAEYKKVDEAVREFAKYLISVGEIETK